MSVKIMVLAVVGERHAVGAGHRRAAAGSDTADPQFTIGRTFGGLADAVYGIVLMLVIFYMPSGLKNNWSNGFAAS